MYKYLAVFAFAHLFLAKLRKAVFQDIKHLKNCKNMFIYQFDYPG